MNERNLKKNMDEKMKYSKRKPHTKFEKAWGILSLLIILYFCYHFIDWENFKGEITAYPVQCKQKVVLGRCGSIDFTLHPTTYKPLEDRQEVLSWSDAIAVERFTKCAVKDRKNWQCSYDDNSATFGFTNGTFLNTYNPTMANQAEMDLLNEDYYVSKFEWMKINCSVNYKFSGFGYYACLLF